MAPDKQITPRNAAQQLNGTTIGKRRKLSYEERARGSEGSRPDLRAFAVSYVGTLRRLHALKREVERGR